MKPNVAAALCAALVGVLALSQSAMAEPKTARQCNSDWTANKASVQARVHGRVPQRADRGTSIRGAGQKPVCERSRGQGKLPERRRRLGQFGIAPVPRQWEPQLWQDQNRRLHVRAGFGGGRLPRSQDRKAPGRLILSPASSLKERSDGAHVGAPSFLKGRTRCMASRVPPQSRGLPSLPPRA